MPTKRGGHGKETIGQEDSLEISRDNSPGNENMKSQLLVDHANVANEFMVAFRMNFDTMMYDISRMMMQQMSLTMKTFVESNQ